MTNLFYYSKKANERKTKCNLKHANRHIGCLLIVDTFYEVLSTHTSFSNFFGSGSRCSSRSLYIEGYLHQEHQGKKFWLNHRLTLIQDITTDSV